MDSNRRPPLLAIGIIFATIISFSCFDVGTGNAGSTQISDSTSNWTVYNPFNYSNAFINASYTTTATSWPGTSKIWTSIALPGVPATAKVAILNVHAALRGPAGSVMSQSSIGGGGSTDTAKSAWFAVSFRKFGSTDVPGYALAGRSSGDYEKFDYNTTVFVPLSGGKIEYVLEYYPGVYLSNPGFTSSCQINVILQGYW